jgi:hypothetical protein
MVGKGLDKPVGDERGGGSEQWEDGVEEVVRMEGQQEEELGGGWTELVRLQVKEESSEGKSVGGRDTDFEEGLSQVRRIWKVWQDLIRDSRD